MTKSTIALADEAAAPLITPKKASNIKGILAGAVAAAFALGLAVTTAVRLNPGRRLDQAHGARGGGRLRRHG